MSYGDQIANFRPSHLAMGEGSLTACEIATSPAGARASRARLEALLAAHHAFVWRSLRRLGVPDRDVDDASQQVFLVAHRRLAEIASESERSFLFQTALRVASEWRRAQKRRCEQSGIDVRNLPDGTASPEELADRRRARALLDRVLAAMPMELRVVFVLFELEEMTMVEIATMANLAPGTVASRLRRARRVFQAAVGQLTTAASARQESQGGR
jgi:RNA polymerase sigma-70 factor (ECF subfamily)